ncbi:hypothetical protein BHU72_08365 [Desulfuribacillus stibiiarsenatis]|uniref:Sporulation protein YpjB n=1 Tax=Desulfuribacillus stibiiarsenatis TaxID=1390249 RepID=A0A1E5L407_9FIRM|nr:hypothetical protein [Desulfuribacillus stibiiarsenatis]OEH84831.1 hypothetical protein BHU72_08365 [Desulfuribacillus stibiiarsenatis]
MKQKIFSRKNLAKLLLLIITIFQGTNICLAASNNYQQKGQLLTDYSSQIQYFVEQEKYPQAREVVAKLIEVYLNTNHQKEISIEAHKAFIDLMITVKTELNKVDVQKPVLAEEIFKLHIASEVYVGKDISSFTERIEELYKTSEKLLNTLLTIADNEAKIEIANLERKYDLISCAIQIMYSQEYHTQIKSIFQHLNQASDQAKLKQSAKALEYLTETFKILNKHASEVNAYMIYTQITPKSYLIGISSITAIAMMTVFWRKWKISSY